MSSGLLAFLISKSLPMNNLSSNAFFLLKQQQQNIDKNP